MKVIANTTIISNFAAVGRLDVLRDLLGEVYILFGQMIQAGYRSPYSNLAELL